MCSSAARRDRFGRFTEKDQDGFVKRLVSQVAGYSKSEKASCGCVSRLKQTLRGKRESESVAKQSLWKKSETSQPSVSDVRSVSNHSGKTVTSLRFKACVA